MGEARAHVLTPSEEVPGGFYTLDGWSVSLVGNEVCGGDRECGYWSRNGRAWYVGGMEGRRRPVGIGGHGFAYKQW